MRRALGPHARPTRVGQSRVWRDDVGPSMQRARAGGQKVGEGGGGCSCEPYHVRRVRRPDSVDGARMDLLGVGLRRAREGFDGWLKRAAGGDTACAGRVPSSCCVEGWGGVSGEWWCWVEREWIESTHCWPGWKSETDMDSWVSEKEMTRDEGCHIARTA